MMIQDVKERNFIVVHGFQNFEVENFHFVK